MNLRGYKVDNEGFDSMCETCLNFTWVVIDWAKKNPDRSHTFPTQNMRCEKIPGAFNGLKAGQFNKNEIPYVIRCNQYKQSRKKVVQ